MTRPQISIITPCLNGLPFLPRTVESVISRRDAVRLEYIVIDGGSADGSIDCLKTYADRIDYWSSEPDSGMYDAIAKGIERSEGEIVGWLNSDDLYFPWTLPMIVDIFTQFPEVEWLSTLTYAITDRSGYPVFMGKLPGFSREAFMDGVYMTSVGSFNARSVGFIQQESTFWRRRLWDRVNAGSVIREYKYAGDFALWCLFISVTPLFAVQAPLGMFRSHAAQITKQNMSSYLEEAGRCLQTLRQHFRYEGTHLAPQAPAVYEGSYIEKSKTADPEGDWNIVKRNFSVLPESNEKTLITSFLIG
jgi:glycosyltransferase involved in cell wall biosynthesis